MNGQVWIVSIGLKTRVAVAISALFVLFATLLAMYVHYASERDYRRTIATQQLLLVNSLAETIDDKLSVAQHALLAESAKVQTDIAANADKAQGFLDHQHSLHAIFDNGLFLFSTDGRLIAESPFLSGRRNRDISYRDYFQITMKTGKPIISAPYQSTHSPGHPAIMMTAPIFSEQGRIAAIMGGSLDLHGSNILVELPRRKMNNHGDLFLLSADGMVIIHPDKTMIMQRHWGGDNSQLAMVLKNPEGTTELVNARKQPVLASFKRLQRTPWIVVAEYPLTLMLAPLERAKQALRLVVLGSTIVVLVVVWLMMYYLMAPLSSFTRHVETLAENGSEEKLFRIKGVNEIATLATAFNSMVVALDSEHDALLESENNFKALAENAHEGMLIVVGLGIILYSNRQAAILLGRAISTLQNVSVESLVPDESRPRFMEYCLRACAGEQVEPVFECEVLRGDGVTIPVEVTCARTVWQGQPAELLVIRDISQRKLAETLLRENEERLFFLAHHDNLTELPNRLLCYDRLRQAISRARRAGQLVGLLFIDLDRFKNINDSLGHEIGDMLLREVAKRFSYWVRETDTVARLGGDEFVIILEEIEDARYAAMVAQKLIGILAQPIVVGGHELYISISIGITLFPSDSTDVDGLMKCADIAMYSAKENGRNNYQFYTTNMNRRTREMLDLEGELRRGLDHEQFMLYFQPQLSLATGALVGMEALVRWRHPVRGVVMPDRFIPLAEDNGLIVPLGEWVIHAACQQGKSWQQRGGVPFRVAVNISPRQFRYGNLSKVIAQALEQTGFDPSCLELEITESMIMGNVEAAVRIMEELNDMGVMLAIDDFGTGYSSLGHLKHFPISRLKIDKSFIRDISENANDAAIAAAIIALAHSMSLEVIAEGIETEEHLRLLRELGCEQGQGYLFSRPQPAHLLQSFLNL